MIILICFVLGVAVGVVATVEPVISQLRRVKAVQTVVGSLLETGSRDHLLILQLVVTNQIVTAATPSVSKNLIEWFVELLVSHGVHNFFF